MDGRQDALQINEACLQINEAWYELQCSRFQQITDLHLSEEVEERLQVLAKVAAVLGIDDVSFSSYSTAITRLSSEKLSLRRSLIRLKHTENELQAHLASAKHEERLINKWTETFRSENQIGESSATLERRREGLIKKAKEYRKELDIITAAMPEEPPVNVSDITTQQVLNREKDKILKAKRAKIKTFQGLPPNIDLARDELRDARNKLVKLIQLRERLLGRMAEGVT